MAAAPTLFLFSALPFTPTPLASAPRTPPPLHDKTWRPPHLFPRALDRPRAAAPSPRPCAVRPDARHVPQPAQMPRIAVHPTREGRSPSAHAINPPRPRPPGPSRRLWFCLPCRRHQTRETNRKEKQGGEEGGEKDGETCAAVGTSARAAAGGRVEEDRRRTLRRATQGAAASSARHRRRFRSREQRRRRWCTQHQAKVEQGLAVDNAPKTEV